MFLQRGWPSAHGNGTENTSATDELGDLGYTEPSLKLHYLWGTGVTGLLRCFCPSQLQSGDRNPLSDFVFSPTRDSRGSTPMPFTFTLLSPTMAFLALCQAQARAASPSPLSPAPGLSCHLTGQEPQLQEPPAYPAEDARHCCRRRHLGSGHVRRRRRRAGQRHAVRRGGPRLPSRTGCCAASSRERPETRSRRLRSGYSG